MSAARRLSRSALTLLISSGGGALLLFALSAVIGRGTGQTGLGVYAAALAWVFPLALLAEFGLGTLITRDAAQDAHSGPLYLQATLRARLLLGGGLSGGLFAAAPLLSSEAAVVDGLRLSAPLVLFAPLFAALTAVFRARQVMWPVALLNLGMLGAQLPLTAIALAAGGDARAALAINTATSAGQLGAAWLIYRWRFALPVTAPLPPARALLRRARPFALAGVLAALQARLGLLLLEQIAGTGETGYYAAASRFIEAGRLAPMALFTALLPALAALMARPGEMARLFRRALIGVSVYAGALAVLFTALAEPALRLAFGEGFSPAAPALVIGAWGLLAALPRAALTLYWYARAGERFVNGVLAAMLAGQVALGLWLIPLHGAAGAALALALVEAGALAALWMRRNALRQ